MLLEIVKHLLFNFHPRVFYHMFVPHHLRSHTISMWLLLKCICGIYGWHDISKTCKQLLYQAVGWRQRRADILHIEGILTLHGSLCWLVFCGYVLSLMYAIYVGFLAATKQLYKWYLRLSVCPSVCLSHLFDYVPIIVSSRNFQELLPMTKVRSKQKVKVRGQRSRSQRSQPNLTVSRL